MSFLLLLILVGALLLTSLLTPAAFELLQFISPTLSWPFSRVFDRVILLVVLVLIWIYRKQLNVRPVLESIRIRGRWHNFFFGFVLAIVMSALLLPIIIGAGDLVWQIRDSGYYLSKVWKVVLGALLTAIIEEFLFRGIILTELISRLKAWIAVVITTTLYAVVHFVAPVKSWVYTGWSLGSGFSYLGAVFSNMFSIAHLAPFCGLFLVGIVLAISKIKTNSLILSIGLHAGWIMAVKSVFYLTVLAPDLDGTLSPLTKRYFLVAQPVAWLGVIVIGFIIIFSAKKLVCRVGK